MKPTIALFLHQPKCSVQSGNGIIKSLEDHYNFKIFTKHELEDDFFNGVDMICFPGGIGDADSFDSLTKSNMKQINEFMDRGGKYLGICMGAYWAGKHYFDFIKDVSIDQYIRRPNTDTRRPHAKNLKVEWLGQQCNMFFYDGCAFGSGQYEIIAKYMNDDPMAIIQGNIGLIGCHPESQPHWYESYSWMRGKYHNGKQHELLLNFVNRLMET
jgi:glutamine amidotransferase-like uncharacterized protein